MRGCRWSKGRPNQALQQTAGHDSFSSTTAHCSPAAAELGRSALQQSGAGVSFSTHEPLAEVIATLRQCQSALKKMLHAHVEVPTLHPTVEAIAILLARYDRGEIVERVPGTATEGGGS
jgi:hypothetical protein